MNMVLALSAFLYITYLLISVYSIYSLFRKITLKEKIIYGILGVYLLATTINMVFKILIPLLFLIYVPSLFIVDIALIYLGILRLKAFKKQRKTPKIIDVLFFITVITVIVIQIIFLLLISTTMQKIGPA